MRSLPCLLLLLTACTRFGPVYPSRPVLHPSPLVADPSPSRVTAHLAMSGDGLRASLEDIVPKTGAGIFTLLGSERAYRWTREPLDVSFASGRIVVKTTVASSVDMPISSIDLAFDVRISAEPVISRSAPRKSASSARWTSSSSASCTRTSRICA